MKPRSLDKLRASIIAFAMINMNVFRILSELSDLEQFFNNNNRIRISVVLSLFVIT